MFRRKRLLSLTLILFAVLIVLPCAPVYRHFEQEKKDQALIAAIKAENKNLVLELLADGANANARETEVHLSFRQTLLRLFASYFRTGASSTTKQQYSPSALFLLYDQALEKGGSSRYPGPTPAIVRALLDHGANIKERDEYGRSVLHRACWYSSVETVDLLLARGVDVEAVNKEGHTPLMEAGSVAVAKVLLEHGAHIGATDNRGQTPLIEAAVNHHPAVMRFLLDQGADASHKDVLGETVHDIVHYDPWWRSIKP